MERDEMERSWDVPRTGITPILDRGLSHAPEILGIPLQPQAHLAVGGTRGSATASSSPQAHLSSPVNVTIPHPRW